MPRNLLTEVTCIACASLVSVSAQNVVDTDDDLLPDEWEITNGLDRLSNREGNGRFGDPDHDGVSNYLEFTHSTDPMDQSSHNAIYVSPNINAGPGDGSRGNPHTNIGKTLSRAADNSVVVLLPGTYNINDHLYRGRLAYVTRKTVSLVGLDGSENTRIHPDPSKLEVPNTNMYLNLNGGMEIRGITFDNAGGSNRIYSRSGNSAIHDCNFINTFIPREFDSRSSGGLNIRMSGDRSEISNCKFSDYRAVFGDVPDYFVLIRFENTVRIENCFFVDFNSTNYSEFVGTKYCVAVHSRTSGGKCYVNNCTFSGNVFTDTLFRELSNTDVQIVNSIFWNNLRQLYRPRLNPYILSRRTNSDDFIFNSIVQGGGNDQWMNIIDSDPLFANDGSYGLSSQSPAIDRGIDKLNDFDFEGDIRFDIVGQGTPGVRTDLGADEFFSFSNLERFPNANWPANITFPGPTIQSFEREEQEFKLSFVGNVPKVENDWKTDASILSRIADNAIQARLADTSIWRVLGNPAYQGFGDQYERREDKPSKVQFFDIYFDTVDGLNLGNKSSLRYRQRFDDAKVWEAYVNGELIEREVLDGDGDPVLGGDGQPLMEIGSPRTESRRREVQAKTGSTPDPSESGFSLVRESRSNISNHRQANVDMRLVDVNRSTLDREINGIQGGRQLQDASPPRTAQLLRGALGMVKFYRERGISGIDDDTEFSFLPRVIVRTERRRQHLLIPIRGVPGWTGGTNPREAFIVSVDTAHVYDSHALISYMRGDTPYQPKSLASFTELEVEWERNVKERLDDARFDDPNNQALNRLRADFRADQQLVTQIIREAVEPLGISLVGEKRSKFAQAAELQLACKNLSPSLAVSKMSYDPRADGGAEFIAFKNVTDSDLDISEYEIIDGVTFDFANALPAAQILSPGQTVYVVRRIGDFEEVFGTGHLIAGRFDGKLANGNSQDEGERIVVVNGDGFECAKFTYGTGSATGWPSTPAEGGTYLAVSDPTLDLELSDPASWTTVAEGIIPPGE